jgi:hypothetical protein
MQVCRPPAPAQQDVPVLAIARFLEYKEELAAVALGLAGNGGHSILRKAQE